MNALEFKISPEQFSNKLLEAKLTVSNTGTGTFKGVTMSYSYNGTDTLVITVIKKPIFIKESYIESKITSWLIN